MHTAGRKSNKHARANAEKEAIAKAGAEEENELGDESASSLSSCGSESEEVFVDSRSGNAPNGT